MRPTRTRTSTSRPGIFYSSRDDAEVRTQTVHNVTSKHELDELVKSASKEGKITVLEVAKLGSIGKEGKPRKSTAPSELETVSVDALHHAVSRVLGVKDERG